MKHSSSGYGSGVLKHCGPGVASSGDAPKHLVGGQARNTLDQAKGSPPDGGSTKGQHQVGKRGSNSPRE
jgi:hypothetical protein